MEMSRRDFVQSAAAAGAGLMLTGTALGQETGTEKTGSNDLNVALIGAGSQGRVLIMSGVKIPGIRFKAVCDIWPYHQTYAANVLKKFNQPVNVYVDYQEMLEKEKGLDAVIIATPDWVHAEQTIACMEAGLHVYCEKEMANTLDGCRQMVAAARKTGKVLQIGHQRRSNPRYLQSKNMIQAECILGRITNVYGQWNRAKQPPLGWPANSAMDNDSLKKYGYDTMERFRNWRWYKRFSGGPMCDLGSHQVDIFNWFLGCPPKAVMASGGADYYKDWEWFDNVLAIYEYQTETGPVRGFYQVLNTTSSGGYYETFMGDEGSLMISEDISKGFIFREITAKKKDWEDEAAKVETMGVAAIELKIGESRKADGTVKPESLKMTEDAKKPIHQPHMENFFDTVRGKAKQACAPETAYQTAVSVHKANEAVISGKKQEIKPEDLKV